MSRPRDPYDWTETWAWPLIERHGETLPAVYGLVALRLAAHGNANGLTQPSARSLARQIGRKSKTTVTRAFAALAELGELEAVGKDGRVTIWKLAMGTPDVSTNGHAVGTPWARQACPEVEVEELQPLSLPTNRRDAGEREVVFDPNNLIELKRVPR